MPRVHLAGFLICRSLEESDRVAAALPDHIRLTHAEPGCLKFEVLRSAADPCRFAVRETFRSPEDFDTHQARTRASAWWKATQHIPREFKITETD
ncbi:MAG: antibiotic biosynthesis monooxygenase [Paracoccaceae bacterium]